MRPDRFVVVTLLCGMAGSAKAQTLPAAKPFPATAAAHTATATDGWDRAFEDTSGNRPLHFTAHYVDAHHATHRLEEWRAGQDHLRRLSDDRIDLHADAANHLPGQPREYIWTILDLQKRVAHRISTVGMMRLGMLYSYYSMAHVLRRPAGVFTVERSTAPAVSGNNVTLPELNLHATCAWWQITASGQPAQRVCWLARYGVPARTYTQDAQGWHLDFQMDALDTRPIAPAIFTVKTADFQVRNVDELQTED